MARRGHEPGAPGGRGGEGPAPPRPARAGPPPRRAGTPPAAAGRRGPRRWNGITTPPAVSLRNGKRSTCATPSGSSARRAACVTSARVYRSRGSRPWSSGAAARARVKPSKNARPAEATTSAPRAPGSSDASRSVGATGAQAASKVGPSSGSQTVRPRAPSAPASTSSGPDGPSTSTPEERAPELAVWRLLELERIRRRETVGGREARRLDRPLDARPGGRPGELARDGRRRDVTALGDGDGDHRHARHLELLVTV